MSSREPSHDGHPPLRICENCGTALQGGFCHLCGQSVHSPVRSFGHAVEEVFESFWHLDGRIFRTLRELFVPGRIAERYLSGHRVCYVAPMRLFVILTLLTVFVTRVVVDHSIAEAMDQLPTDEKRAGALVEQGDPFAVAGDPAQIERIRARLLDGMAAQRAAAADQPGTQAEISAAERVINAQAGARLKALERAQKAAAEKQKPQPAQAQNWLERGTQNLREMNTNPKAAARTLVSAAPTTLFILVPLFALLLKTLYLFKRRLYLEHVVVGLYSHAYLMLALLLVFVCSLVAGWIPEGATWASKPLGWLQALLLLSMPLYLLLMQKRVYRQGWLPTLLKYGVIGAVYAFMFLLVAVFTAIYKFSEM